MFKKIDHKIESLQKFLYQFQEQKNIKVLIHIISKQLNEIEETLKHLKEKRSIDHAVGKQLDILGHYKNCPRFGQIDKDYRQSIRNQIALDSASGSCESVLNSAKIILGGQDFLYSESPPARCEIFVSGAACTQAQYNLLKKTVPLGVALGIRFCDKKPFGFKHNSLSNGFGSIHNLNIGGGLASIIGDIG